jgi:hypothetical protein
MDMELIIILIICALACWYLFRRFSRAFKSDRPSCGCDECSCGDRKDSAAGREKTHDKEK